MTNCSNAVLVSHLLALNCCDQFCITLIRQCTIGIVTTQTLDRYKKRQSEAVGG